MRSSLTYPMFIAASIFLPRNADIWVFGHYNGYNENTKYFFEYASSMNEYDCYWLANDVEELKKVKDKGYNAILKNSIEGYWYASRASLTFICTGFGDVNRLLSLNSKVINFWHGTPIKKVFFDVEVKKNIFTPIRYSLNRFLVSRIDFYYASSSFEQDIVCKAARISINKSAALGSPRFDNIRNPVFSKTLSEYSKKYSKIILFAPTWREQGHWADSYNLTNSNISDLNTFLTEENAILIIKPHPKSDFIEMKNWGLIKSDRIIYVQDLDVNDINDFYTYIDILVTDVSSVIFDFLIFNKPVIFFMPDVVDYVENERGVYSYFEKNLLEFSIRNWSDLILQLKSSKMNNSLLSDVSKEIQNLKDTNRNIYTHLIDNFCK